MSNALFLLDQERPQTNKNRTNKPPSWAAIHRDADFTKLHQMKSRFLRRLMAISVLVYFLLPIGADYFPEIFKIKLWGPLNVGLVFALSQFGVAWGIALIYARCANREFDPRAAALIALHKVNDNTVKISVRCTLMTTLFGIAPAFVQTGGAVAAQYKWLTFLVFGLIIAVTMFVTYLAARRVKSAHEFYAAGQIKAGKHR